MVHDQSEDAEASARLQGENAIPKRRSRRRWPKLQRRYVIGLGVLLLACLALGIVQICLQLSHNPPTTLLPPNPLQPLPPSHSQLRRFRKAAVCSDGAPCSEVGRDILARNGSVVDAAIATMFCNGIVNCQSMGLGGGFLMTLYINKTAYTLNAREAAPLKAFAEMFVTEPQKARIGVLAVAVPGELKGYWEAHKRFGVLPWQEVVSPAIKICEEGYNMTKHQADSLQFNIDNIYNDNTLRDVFVDPSTGKMKKWGSVIHHKKLCETLKIIAKNGGDDLYHGTLAKKLVADIAEMGGLITEDDLKNYKAKWADPISVNLDHHTMYSVPPPGSGILLGLILNILKGYHFTPSDVADINSTITTYHRITESFKYAFAQRTELGDPDFVDIKQIVSELSSPDYAEHIRGQISDNKTSNDSKTYGAVFYNQQDHGTAHISIIDQRGDAVSATSTVNLYFGAGITSTQTGIILNSGMDDFSIPRFENYFGLPPSPANFIAPGKRSLSSMCPAIIVGEDGEVQLVVGASGGTKITTAVAQIILRYLWLGQDLKKAIDASRFHHQLHPMEFSYEYGILDQVIKGLEKLGHKTSRYRERGSIICAVAKQLGYVFANADFRKGGEVYGIN